ncbi:hypothetical protein B0O99DRAFT_688369 [Bisporella sp. PMI_857]|nr:hypothetical protein B0O99DRAFT_688369 [Bisporella sp. PMI_857]
MPSKYLTAQFYEELSKSLIEKLHEWFSFPDQPENFVEPILLIACGDGGLVVENAVIYSAENPKCFQSIAGVIFMDSPVCGSKGFSDNMSKKISRDLIPDEERFLGSSGRIESKEALNSDQLKDLFVKFNRKRVERGIEIWFFQPKDMKIQGLELLNGQTSRVWKAYNDIGKFRGSKYPGFEKIMLKLMHFSNARQLMNAAKEGRLNQVKRIISQEEIHGAGVDYQNPRGAAALHESVKNGREELLQWLVKLGNASVGLADNMGCTALHFAVRRQSVKVVRMLLEVDANVRARSTEGKSPLDIAKEKAKEEEISGEKAVEECKQHTITAVEFFVGKGPVCKRRTVYDMIYSKLGAGPFGILNRARKLAMENEKSTWNADTCANKDNGPQLAEPKSVCRWYHIPAQNIAWVHMPFTDYESIIEYNKMVKAINTEGVNKQFSNIMEILQRMNVLLESLTASLRETKQTLTSEIEDYPSNSTHGTGYGNHTNHSAGVGLSDEEDVDEISDVESSIAKLSLISGYLNHEYPLLLRWQVDMPLWAWVTPGHANSEPDMVITCCSQRWCSESPRDSDLLNSILKFEGRAPAINTAHELLDRITSRCASLFDHSSASKDLQFMQFFRSAIGSVSDEETKLFKEFDRLSQELSGNQSVHNAKERKKRAETLNQLLEIEKETKLLINEKILRKAREDIESLQNLGLNPGPEYLGFREASQKTINNIEDFKKSQAQAKKIQQALNHLLELKSRQANAWEARFAREGGEEIARQGTVILIFTIVNIISLPLSFMAAFMALNIAQFPRDITPGNDGGILWPISTALRLLLSVSLGISTVIILAALNLSAIRDLLKTYITFDLVKIPKPIWETMSLLVFWREKALRDAPPHVVMDTIIDEIEQHERSIFRGGTDSEDAKSESNTDAEYSESEESGSAGPKDSTQGWPRWRGVKTLRDARQMKWPKDLRWWRKNIEMKNTSSATVAEGDQRV